MKGRKAPPRPEIAAIVHKAEPLTMADIEHAIEMHMKRQYLALPSVPAVLEHMPEPTPFERGVLDRYQDGKPRR